jgi:hypothetical protein
VPDIFEVESFCECYKVTYGAILQAFGLRLGVPDPAPGLNTVPRDYKTVVPH